MSEIPSYKTEKLTIAISTSRGSYKILKLIFGKKDGSIFLAFPYFRNSKGIVSIGSIPKGTSKTDVNIGSKGRVTSHLIKYSHHCDGNVLFSQDRKIFSKIKKKSKPLTNDAGHIFTIKLQDLEGFEAIDGRQTQKECNCSAFLKNQILYFSYNSAPEAIQLLGYWYTKRYVNINQTGITNPAVQILKNNEELSGFLISPANVNTDFVLILIHKAISKFTEESGSHLTFIGGFDSRDIVNDISKDTSFLSFMYPVTDYEKLKSAIGSIDFQDNL